MKDSTLNAIIQIAEKRTADRINIKYEDINFISEQLPNFIQMCANARGQTPAEFKQQIMDGQLSKSEFMSFLRQFEEKGRLSCAVPNQITP